MQTLKEWVEDKTPLLEMPYVYFDTPEGDKQFDLELERLSFDEIQKLIIMLFSGKALTDKYDNTLQLTSDAEKEEFKNKLKEKDLKKSQIMALIMKKYGPNINPIIRPVSIKPELRDIKEIDAYNRWVEELYSKSKNLV